MQGRERHGGFGRGRDRDGGRGDYRRGDDRAGRFGRRPDADGPDLEVKGRGAVQAARFGVGGSGRDRPRGEENGGRGAGGTRGGGGDLAALRAEKAAKAAAGPAGGAYIPPFKLAQMMAEVTDKRGADYQRMTWDALRKSINGLVNKVNSTNLKQILPEFFQENLVRGRGLLCRSIMKSQLASPSFTPVYAALVAVVNTKLPEVGELLLHRAVLQFKRSYRRNDKPICTAAVTLVAHLVNQAVCHEVLALEILMLLLENPTDDSVDLAVAFTKEVGAALQDLAPQGLHAVFERFRAILHEGDIGKKVQYQIEALFALRKKGFEAAGHPARKAELDLVEEDDQITHELSLDDPVDAKTKLDVFQFDEEYDAHEEDWGKMRAELLGEDSEEGSESGDSSGSSEEESESEEEGGAGGAGPIADQTQTNIVNLRRTIYLTIMSSMDFEEAGHKLMKIGLKDGQEIELVTMIIECCSQERTYLRYYGLLAQRLCLISRTYQEMFEGCFERQYALIHRLETVKIRNVAKLFGHLLSSDAVSWAPVAAIRLTEEDTTSSSRIFIKFLFQELSEAMGIRKLNERLQDPQCLEWFGGLFPKDSPKNVRFSINFFTSIGLGGLTDNARAFLKELPALIAKQREQMALQQQQQQSSSSTTSSSSDTSSDTSSDSSSSSGTSSGTSSDTSDSSSSSSDATSSDSGSSSDSEDSRDSRRRPRSRSTRDRRPSPPPRSRGEREGSARSGRSGRPPRSRSPERRRSRSRDSRGDRRRGSEGRAARSPSPPPARSKRRVASTVVPHGSPRAASPPDKRRRRE
ncbi:unnamed protein product [Pedinophyceae sp. YPF-701]|nr:unnamed protein product [Pedinophyceae sp. YPF-701]